MKWFCSVCGYVYEGEQEPECCPSCNERKFIKPTYAFSAQPASVAVQEQVLATPQMVAYLDHLYKVETVIYEQTALQERLNMYLQAASDAPANMTNLSARELHGFNMQKIREKMLDVPAMQEAGAEVRKKQLKVAAIAKNEPVKPRMGVTKPADVSNLAKLNFGDYVCFFAIVIGALNIFLGNVTDDATARWIGIAALIIGVIMEAVSWSARRSARYEHQHKQDAYRRAEERYREDMKEYDSQRTAHYHEKKQANIELEEALQKQNEVRTAVLAQTQQFIESNLTALNDSLMSLCATREGLYARNIIFPKYRTLPCVSTMLEYMQAGRVTELTGPNGAYNLYEAELRQNLIIAHVESIATELETIKKNQYNLYQSVEQTNRVLETMNDQMEEQLRVQKQLLATGENVQRIASIAASCAEASAKNTEAIKYLSLVN